MIATSLNFQVPKYLEIISPKELGDVNGKNWDQVTNHNDISKMWFLCEVARLRFRISGTEAHRLCKKWSLLRENVGGFSSV